MSTQRHTIEIRVRPWWRRVLRAPRTFWGHYRLFRRHHWPWTAARLAWALTRLTLRRWPPALFSPPPPPPPRITMSLSPVPRPLPIPGDTLWQAEGGAPRRVGVIETMTIAGDALQLTLSPSDHEPR